MKKLLVPFVFFLAPFIVLSQQFGGNPPSIKWDQINTDTARVIFPRGMDSVAQRVSAVVHWLAKNNPAPLGGQMHKIDIVLQGQTTISNAYVSLAPFRSEFFLTPTLNNFEEGSISWPEALAVHEFRHVEQFNNFRTGLSRVAYYLFGQEGLLVAENGAVPDWFFEGDAVYNETITTNQGRGRIPFFLNQYKAVWLSGKQYSWMKLRNNSLKHYVPNHYPLGYLMVNYGREKYGLDFWTRVTHDASAFKGLFYPFQKAIKKYSGVDYARFREDAFNHYKSLANIPPGDSGWKKRDSSFQNQQQRENIKNITALNKKFLINYVFPFQVGADSLVYLKSSFRHRDAFVLMTSGGEHHLRARDISIDQQFSYRAGKIVYAAYEPDPRWGWKDFSVIKILDINTRKERTLRHGTKYFTPDLSPDGSKVAAVQILPGGRADLEIMNATDGSIIQQFHSSELGLFTDPRFIDEGSLVTAVRLSDGRMALAMANIRAGSVERLTNPSYGVLGFLSCSNGIVYFTGSYSGNDELYALDLQTKKVSRLTGTALGNYFVNADRGRLTWSGFTADGYQLREMDSSKGKWIEAGEMEMRQPVVEFPVAHAGELHDILQKDVPTRKFATERYKQGKHLFYFHSWRPYFADPDYTYSVYSDNILNNFSAEIFYHYNSDDKTNGVGANLLYGGWYPFINGGMEYTFRQPVSIGGHDLSADKLETRIGLSLPLNLTRGRSYKFLDAGTNYVYEKQISRQSTDSIRFADFSYLHHHLSWSQYIQQAVQHIYPRLGYGLSMDARHAISFYHGYQVIGNGTIYLPGFYSTHSIVLTAAIQQRDTTNILFSNSFANARGYNDYYFSRMWRASVNYHFPIIIPDWGFANLLYFQRIRGNAFFDFERVYSNDKSRSRDLRTVGGEIYFDTKWWNEYPLSFGIRLSHLLDQEIGGPTRKNVFEFIVPIVIPQ